MSSSPPFYIDPAQLEIEASIYASGASAHVFRGIYQGTPVAIKRFLTAASDQYEVGLHAELQHKNVVKCIGQSRTGDGLPLLVMEFIPHTLGSAFPVPLPYRNRVCGDIVSAVAYLHSRRIVHSEIKPENILLDDDFNVKVSDMGQSLKLKTIQSSLSLTSSRVGCICSS